jgi:hypothetical protein
MTMQWRSNRLEKILSSPLSHSPSAERRLSKEMKGREEREAERESVSGCPHSIDSSECDPTSFSHTRNLTREIHCDAVWKSSSMPVEDVRKQREKGRKISIRVSELAAKEKGNNGS